MICSRRLYKGNAYEICLPLTDTGVTLVRFYTKGDVIVEKEPETTGDSMCFSFTEEDLALLEDGVLRYGHDDFDTNSPYVVVTPGDYSGSTLDDLLEDAFDSGYTAGQEDCSGGTCEGIWESGYTSGYTDGVDSIQEITLRENITDNGEYAWAPLDGLYKEVYLNVSVPQTGYTQEDLGNSYASGYTSGKTDGFDSGVTYQKSRMRGFAATYTSNASWVYENKETGYDKIEITIAVPSDSGVGYTSGYTDGYESGYTAGQEDCSGSTTDADLIANLQGDYYVIPEGTTRLRNYAFGYACFSSITIPDSVTEIGTATFSNNSCLTSITIPDSVQSVGNSAFWNCRGLLSVTIGSGLTGLSDTMFSGARSLTGITIPSTITNIGNSTFDTSGLTHMTFEGLVPPALARISGGTASLGSTAYTFPIYVPCESVEDYKTAFGQYYAPRITCSGSPEPVYSAMPLTFEIISGGTIGWDNSQTNVNIEYSVDSGQTWQNFTSLNVNAGDKVMFRGTGHTGFDGPDSGVDLHASRFTASTNTYFNAVGNIHSLLSSDYTGITNLGDYGGAVFFGLFSGNTGLVSAENLKLPAQTLVGDCYRDMFASCSNLTTAPELPAHDIYWATGCYMYMFHSCSSLNYIKCLATGSVYGRTSDWVTGVSRTGTFVKAAGMNDWPSGYSGIPTGWTVVDAT